MGFLRHYERLLTELIGFPDAAGNKYVADSQVLCDRNFNIACETGICYPKLPTMLNCNALLIRISERSIQCNPGLSYVILGYVILQMGYLDSPNPPVVSHQACRVDC